MMYDDQFLKPSGHANIVIHVVKWCFFLQNLLIYCDFAKIHIKWTWSFSIFNYFFSTEILYLTRFYYLSKTDLILSFWVSSLLLNIKSLTLTIIPQLPLEFSNSKVGFQIQTWNFVCFLQNVSCFQSRKSSWRETTQGPVIFKLENEMFSFNL